MIPNNELRRGGYYRIDARNFCFGVWYNIGFVGLREKFGSYRLDYEFPYETGGTVTPVRYLEQCPIPSQQEEVLFRWLWDTRKKYQFLLEAESTLTPGTAWADRVKFIQDQSIPDTSKISVWLDDVRPMPDGFSCHAKNADEAIALLADNKVGFISFDHDLGAEKTGYDVAKWIEKAAFTRNLDRVYWAIHSANPVGRANMEMALEGALKAWNDIFQKKSC